MTPEEKLELAKQMRIEADEAWACGSKDHSTYLHGAAALLKKEAEAEIAVQQQATEFQVALDAWRGLTEEQRERCYVEASDLDTEHKARALLKAAAR